jgi:hypothetical protein
VILYNYFQSRLQRTQTELKLVADEFLEVLKERQGMAQAPASPNSSPGATIGTPAVTAAAPTAAEKA